MSENLNTRLNYHGGGKAYGRMVWDKVYALRKALIYSYQSGTAVLADGREFRALFNPSSTKADYDTKMLSIPYKDVCLNGELDKKVKMTEGIEPTDVKNGDVIVWKENNTHWLVYIEHKEEIAYFRADIRRCDQTIKIGDNTYWVYLRGPVETELNTGQKTGLVWNNLNYSEVMYITRNKETDEYFHRFSTIKIGNIENTWTGGSKEKTWKVVSVNPYYGDGIVQVFLDEEYENSIEEARKEEIAEEEAEGSDEQTPQTVYIEGPRTVDIYSTNTYTIVGLTGGTWKINSKYARISSQTSTSVSVTIVTGKSNKFNLIYQKDEQEIVQEIEVQSF